MAPDCCPHLLQGSPPTLYLIGFRRLLPLPYSGMPVLGIPGSLPRWSLPKLLFALRPHPTFKPTSLPPGSPLTHPAEIPVTQRYRHVAAATETWETGLSQRSLGFFCRVRAVEGSGFCEPAPPRHKLQVT